MIKQILFSAFSILGIASISFGQASDCIDGQAGCDAVVNGFPISPSGYGTIEESNFGANNVSWPPSNPQGVNSGCMFANELNSTWISFTILNSGVMEFSLGVAGSGGYFDWILWENLGGTGCDDILNDVLSPVSCNWNSSAQGFTGMSQGGPPPGGVAGNFQPSLNVTAGQQFILCFSNYSGLSNVTVPLNNNGSAAFSCASPTSIDPTICAGDTTTLSINGLPPNMLSYSWSPATNISNATAASPDVWPTDTTTYTCTLTNIDSTWTHAIKVYVHQIPLPDAGLDDSLCHSLSFGADLIAIPDPLAGGGNLLWTLETALTNSGGPGNAVFSSNSTAATMAIVNLAGYYTYIITETDPTAVCPDGSDTVNVYYSDEFHTSTFVDPSCFGFTDGSITVITDNSAAYGGLGAIEYSIDGGVTWQSSNTFTGLGSNGGAAYTIMSRDYLGCDFTSTVILTDPPEILIALVSSDTTICQNGTATMVVSASGAPAGGTYTYTWTDGGSTTNQNIYTPAPAGTDLTTDITAMSDLGCASTNMVTINVSHHAPLNLTVVANDSICPGYDSSPAVTVVGGGFLNGLPDYSYSWTANGSSTGDLTPAINVNPTSNTQYCVTVSDVCETTPITECTDVIMRRVPQPLFDSDLTWGCNPTTITFNNLTDPQDVDSIIWTINNLDYYNVDPLAVTFDEVGLYDVQLEVYSQYGCHNSITALEYIEIHDVPNPMFYANPNPSTIFDTGITMNNITDGASNTYSWSMPGGSPAASVLESPSVYYPEGIADDYPVTLTVTNEWGCISDITGVVHIVSDVIIYAPNIFTPDGDEFNESWRVYIDGIDVYDFHITMYNRWGEPVWESYNQIGEWKGTYGPDGLMDGTFVWLVECKEQSTDKKYEFRGHVTVLK